MIFRISTIVGRRMSLIRQMVLSLVAVALLAGPAAAQTYWASAFETRTGEQMAAFHAYVGDRPNATYPYRVYGVLRSRPEGYFWQSFRTPCDGSAGFASSWGFVRWDDGAQSGGSSLFDLLPEGVGQSFAQAVHCAGYKGPGSVEGRDEALERLRDWQQAAP